MAEPSDKLHIPTIQYFDPSLNASQKEAVKFALESVEVACIHGPPGNVMKYLVLFVVHTRKVLEKPIH
jgi:hypothetical protein